MLQERGLDLARAHLVPAGLDQVGRSPPNDPHPAVRSPRGQVAGSEPAVLHHRRSRVGPVEVPQKQIRSAHRYLADRLVVAGVDRRAVVANQPQVHARERRPHLRRDTPRIVAPSPKINDGRELDPVRGRVEPNRMLEKTSFIAAVDAAA